MKRQDSQINSSTDLVRNSYGYYEFKLYDNYGYIIAVSNDSYKSYKAAMYQFNNHAIQWDYCF